MINPVKGYKPALFPKGDVTQWFAENPKLYAPMGLQGHNGIDIVRMHGEELYAVEDGQVVSVKEEPTGYGRNVRILSKNKNASGSYNLWVYGHNSENLVKQGDVVKAGQLIAYMGNTGFVVSGYTPFWKNNPYRGTHLHLGLRLVTMPRRGGWSYPGSNIKIDIIDYDNGYKGSIDPTPYLVGATDLPSPTVQQLQLKVIELLTALKGLLTKNKA